MNAVEKRIRKVQLNETTNKRIIIIMEENYSKHIKIKQQKTLRKFLILNI